MYRRNLFARPSALLWCGLLLLTQSHTADAQTAQQIARKAFESTVLLVMEEANGQPVSLGSGFFVRDAEIASNLHVVEGASRGYAKVLGQKTKYDIEGIIGIDPDRDLVLLKIQAAHTIPLSLGNSDAVEIGEAVYAVGNPQGLEGTFSQGIVSSIRQVGSDKLLQITAPISPGSSGGPVLNSKGEVIGVSVATFRGGQNLNFAIPSNYLKALLAKAGPAKPLAGGKSSAQQRSILADLGGPSTHGVVGGQMVWGERLAVTDSTFYSFSLYNQLREDIRDVYCLVVFYDVVGRPIEHRFVRYNQVIPAGLAIRVKGSVDSSVSLISARVEFRVLDFQRVD